jgi:hypothetical protein
VLTPDRSQTPANGQRKKGLTNTRPLQKAARKAGLAFGAVTWGYAIEAALRAQAPDMVFSKMDDIVKNSSTKILNRTIGFLSCSRGALS